MAAVAIRKWHLGRHAAQARQKGRRDGAIDGGRPPGRHDLRRRCGRRGRCGGRGRGRRRTQGRGGRRCGDGCRGRRWCREARWRCGRGRRRRGRGRCRRGLGRHRRGRILGRCRRLRGCHDRRHWRLGRVGRFGGRSDDIASCAAHPDDGRRERADDDYRDANCQSLGKSRVPWANSYPGRPQPLIGLSPASVHHRHQISKPIGMEAHIASVTLRPGPHCTTLARLRQRPPDMTDLRTYASTTVVTGPPVHRGRTVRTSRHAS
jgi:hypothetical protein